MKQQSINPYEYGTPEQYIFWAFKVTDMNLNLIKKKTAVKFCITQVKAGATIREVFTPGEIKARQLDNAEKHGANFDKNKARVRHIEQFYAQKKLDNL
ncbi:MAG: hypothetical protein PF440_01255 [Thiomicrorhabdus sp.]|jgi:hypothetical protein|nr:hypothetical protein [Thiomicrorhabdus sp.]